MEKKYRKSVGWLSAALVLLWLVSMVCATITLAEVYRWFLLDNSAHSEDAEMYMETIADTIRRDSDRFFPGSVDIDMMQWIMNQPKYVWTHQENYASILLDAFMNTEKATVFYDTEGNVLHKSGDFLCFGYQREASWWAESPLPDGYGWIEMEVEPGEQDPWAPLREIYSGKAGGRKDVNSARIQGTWEGNCFHPAKFDYVHEIQEGEDPVKLDREGKYPWVNLFDHTEEKDNAELVTIYTCYTPWLYDYEEKPIQVRYGNKRYESLCALVEDTVRIHTSYGPRNVPYTVEDVCEMGNLLTQKNLWRVIVFDGHNVQIQTGVDKYGEPVYQTEFSMMTAAVSYPLLEAMRDLIWVYLITFGLLAFGLMLCRKNSRAFFWQIEQNNTQKNEITRLNKALDYAHRAEENRRALVSGVAHELKTPLAVIHGYAEGLKERIAEDKRDRYLDTILSETERMDGLVLQMLDLSRLEAGKVKLARDTFDLGEMVREVFGKLELLAAQKNLELSFEMPEKLVVTADRGRIEQVVTNFASNAVRYTPPGGWIRVRIFSREDGWGMTVENKSSPFSPEQLERVFDSFYRIDESRTGKGTGLGLAIARSIVELHGGNCHVRNTGPGVEFGFSVSVK